MFVKKLITTRTLSKPMSTKATRMLSIIVTFITTNTQSYNLPDSCPEKEQHKYQTTQNLFLHFPINLSML